MHAGLMRRMHQSVVTVFPFETNLAKILATLQTDQIARIGLVRSFDRGTG